MTLSPLAEVGVAQVNDFPVYLGRINGEAVVGDEYREFNESLARELMAHKDQGMINLILVSENPNLKLPSSYEITQALKTDAGRFLEEILRQLVLVGFEHHTVPTITKFSSEATGVKVTSVKTVEEAYQLLKIQESP